MVLELEKTLSIEKANFDRKKGLLKKRLAEAEWLNSEYQHDINTLKKQLREKATKLDTTVEELGKKEGTVQQLHEDFEKQKQKAKEGEQKEQKLQQTIKDLYQKQTLMTPRKTPLMTTSTPKVTTTSPFQFPTSSPRRVEETKKPSISYLLNRESNGFRSSDSLLYSRKEALEVGATKIAVPKLKLENVLESQNDDLGEFTTVEQDGKEEEQKSEEGGSEE